MNSKQIIKSGSFLKMLDERPIILLPLSASMTQQELRDKFPDKQIIACDFCIEKIEEGEEKPWGYEKDRIISIDHHEPIERMAKRISSTTLAIEYAKTHSPDLDSVVLINHTDCDSILSSAIICGILPPDSKFNDAAIAADHTGSANDISDLLQSMTNKRDTAFSLRNLEKLLNGEPIGGEAKIMLDKNLHDRIIAKKIVDEGKFKNIGDVYFADVDSEIESVLFPPLLPDAAVVITAIPLKDDPSKLVVKVRLGNKAPKNFYLNKLNLPDFGGRWNAGNTKRHGGTSVSLEDYAGIIQKELEKGS